jgi:predicted DNA-binding transcriptional regulator AlpA
MNQPVLNQKAPLSLYRGRGQPDMTDHTHDAESGIAASLEAGSLITIKEIQKIFCLGRTAAYELTHRPGFPAPVPISQRCYRWWAKEVAAFAAKLREQPATTVKIGHRQKEMDQASHSRDAQSLRITGEVRVVRSRKGKPVPLRETPSE